MAKVVPYSNSTESKKEQVSAMFNNIAAKYDKLNQALSLGIHRIWRKKTIALLRETQPKQILDVATGTADFAIEALKLSPDKITGIDISENMLAVGRKKIEEKKLSAKINLLLADSENLPFPDHSFDAITVGFGVRNFENLEKGLSEMNRVLKNNGTLAILEFSKPKAFGIKQLYKFYFNYVCPLIGKMISKDNRAYNYLPESVYAFPDRNELISILQTTGYTNCYYKSLSLGVACIYIGHKA